LTGSGYRRARGIVAADGNSVFVWDAKTGRQFLSYRSAAWSVDTISFADDGKTIVAGGGDGDRTLRRYEWDACVPLPALLELVSAKTSRELSADERARYVSDRTLLGWLMNRLAW